MVCPPPDYRSATPQELAAALTALGTFNTPPSDQELAEAERVEGTSALTARLANALYGSALAHVMIAETRAFDEGDSTGYRHEAWKAAGADSEGIAILLHYNAMRLSSELEALHQALPIDLGIIAAANGAANALKLLLETCTVRTFSDPRAKNITTNLSRAVDQLNIAADHITGLFAAARAITHIE
jgi:hypothetical protein